MNTVILKGIPRDIKYSHTIGNLDYYQCNFYVTNPKNSNLGDVVIVKFKLYSNRFVEGKEIEIFGNIRSYTVKNENKSKVTIYVFTYLDVFENADNDYNYVELSGRICKKDILWKSEKTGKHSYHFILANNIFADGVKINSYIPCVAYGKLAIELSKLDINSRICFTGQIRSRSYNKVLDNGEIEVNVAHEVLVTNFRIADETDDI